MRRLVLATNNPGKVREFERLLGEFGVECVTPSALGLNLDVEETGATYAENATIKARAFAEAARMPALADDSGLEVDALQGRPGLYSARYGGHGLDDTGRSQRLLSELEGVPPAARTARYRAVVAIAEPGSDEVSLFEGVQEGSIACERRGTGGFGYDPVFLVDGIRTQAELSTEEKDRISHRGSACRLAGAYLRQQR